MVRNSIVMRGGTMKVEFLKAQNEDFDELVDFINYVFSHDGGGTDFPSLLPKLYRKEYNQTKNHYIVKENGKIKAVVGAFPMELDVLGKRLSVSGIGSVAVHPYSRGCGYMKKLMNMALDDMKKQGVHMSCLGGKRQRYEYFGYAFCGQKAYFTINNENVRHKLSGYLNKEMVFKEVKETDFEVIDAAYDLYNEGKIKIIRDKSSFFHLLKSWNFNIYAIYKAESFIGYIVLDKENHYISELVVQHDEDYLTVLANYINSKELNNINLEIPIWEKTKIKQLNEFAEDITLHHSYQFNILNYEETIDQLLKFKASYSDLKDGMMRFEVLEYGKFEICINNKEISVNRIEGECDVLLSHIEAMQLFFSPFGQHLVDDELFNHLIHSWFPAPLFMPTQDKV